jgi:glycerate kinase
MRSKQKTKAGEATGIVPGPLRVLIVPDKFKGTLAAADVCAAIAKGWKSVRAGDRLKGLPMSDGGDGFGGVLGQLLPARLRSVRTLDAAHQPIRADWWWVAGQELAIIEAARVIGLAMLPPKKFHPFHLDTFGLGRVLQAAANVGARKCVIGIGGSATNDGGFGLARALGWKFRDQSGRTLEQWSLLRDLASVEPPSERLRMEMTVAVDVGNPLLGPRGCTRVYGPQKGIEPEDVLHAERCLRRLKTVVEQTLNLEWARTPGAGAAGGLGFGLMAFAGAKPQSGFEVFCSAARLEERLRQSDLVITGEGAVDRQTGMGKGVGQVMRLCRKLKIPCITLAGAVEAGIRSGRLFSRTFALTDITSLDEAKARPDYHLARLSALTAGGLDATAVPSSVIPT